MFDEVDSVTQRNTEVAQSLHRDTQGCTECRQDLQGILYIFLSESL